MDFIHHGSVLWESVELGVFVMEVSVVLGTERFSLMCMTGFGFCEHQLMVMTGIVHLLEHQKVYMTVRNTHFMPCKMPKDVKPPLVAPCPDCPCPKPKRKCSQLQLRNLAQGREKSRLYNKLKGTKGFTPE
jgi:hypothetical protein